MARYRTIDIRIWMDAKFMSLDEGSQLLFIYLLTCPQINQWDEGTKNGPDRSALLGHNFVYQETKPHGFYSSYFHQRISS